MNFPSTVLPLLNQPNHLYLKGIIPLQLTEDKEKSSVDQVFPGHFKNFYQSVLVYHHTTFVRLEKKGTTVLSRIL